MCLAVLPVAGCGSVDRRADAAAAVAEQLRRAVANGDGVAACALLAPSAVAELEPACPEAVIDEDLPTTGAVRGADVYGQWAQVRLDDDTVFLAAFGGGWRVVAAGCRSRGEAEPYDCTVQGR
ncbi:hypothetical protein [Paractinoplanes rishiriensis]|uniref:Uncharacterized protein n=1 Tax=Paractinoplanes rishiriensis TaxID=1050105 RepID=A0A919JZV9_9ACTN|nr:hypothetical protein [Actinoplanes rishiriensis]GIE97753.1 hypothetical protein Ari01nite_52180 [Actinoplanes rishiriensis]